MNNNTKYLLLQIFYYSAFAIIWVFAKNYLEYQNMNNKLIGITLAIAPILYITIQPMFANLLDKLGSKYIKTFITSFTFIVILITISLIYINNIFFSSFAFIMIGFIMMSLMPFMNTIPLLYKNNEINFGLCRAFGSLSFALSSLIIGMLIHKFSPRIQLYIGISCLLLIILFTIIIKIPDTQITNNNNSNLTYTDFFKKYKSFSILCLAFMLIFISHMIINTYAFDIVKKTGGNEKHLGIIFFVAAISEMPCMIFFNKLKEFINLKILVTISCFFIFLKIFLSLIASNTNFLISIQFVQALGYGLFIPSTIYLSTKIIDNNNISKSQALLAATTNGAGGVIGNFLGGFLQEYFHINTVLIIGSVIALTGVLIVILILKNLKI